MLSDLFWISEAQATLIHAAQLKEHGGGSGVRDIGLLQSALARARQILSYDEEADICRLAAAYGYALANNHPFVDGNKRTAYVCMRTFLLINGYNLSAN